MNRLLIYILFLLPLSVNAEEVYYNDTTFEGDTIHLNTKSEKVFCNRWIQSTYIGVPLIAAGFIEKSENNHFSSLRNSFLPRFNHSLDNYLQYSPAALMLALKAGGVESRSSWGKMLTADLFSAALVTLSTRIIKPLAHEQRPDGSNYHSFPSGHTATAFMTATMLTKEYGHLSPWIGYGAYTVATATGVMRMMNNKHWMSDILAGAGFGIIGTEFGYWLSDLVFPSHPKSYNPSSVVLLDTDKNPSFVGTYAGFYIPLQQYTIGNNVKRKDCNGGTYGFEGAYFFNQHWGIGGQTSISNINYILDDEQLTEETTHFFSGKVGGYFYQSLYERLYFMAKGLCGYTYYPKINNNIIDNPDSGGLGALAGINIGLRAKQHLDFKVGLDYEIFPSPVKNISNMNALVLTGSANIRF